jgi:hypothetical protein
MKLGVVKKLYVGTRERQILDYPHQVKTPQIVSSRVCQIKRKPTLGRQIKLNSLNYVLWSNLSIKKLKLSEFHSKNEKFDIFKIFSIQILLQITKKYQES